MDIVLLKSVLGVTVTLGALVFLAFYLKKLNQINLKNKLIKIKEMSSITTKIKLAIIEVGEENLLFSISEKEIKLIKKIPGLSNSLSYASCLEKELKNI